MKKKGKNGKTNLINRLIEGYYQKFGSQTFHTKGVTLVDCWIYVFIDYQCTTLTLRRFALERNHSDMNVSVCFSTVQSKVIFLKVSFN